MRAVMLRLVISFSILVLFGALTQAAACYPQRRILGFSPDGRYFAFEQFGTVDCGGSDNSFSKIIVIDTHKNRFVKGTPFHTIIYGTVNARRETRKKAEVLLKSLKIEPKYRVLASTRLLQEGGIKQTFARSAVMYEPIYQMTLRHFDVTLPKGADSSDSVAGFTLHISDDWPEWKKQASLVGGYPKIKNFPTLASGYPDFSAVPYYGCAEYPCAVGYSISDVIDGPRYVEGEGDGVMVVLIGARYSGHNNNIARYLAIARRWGDWGKLGVAH